MCSVPYVCSPCSCLWDHNGFWQICPNCHSCQQTQVVIKLSLNTFYDLFLVFVITQSPFCLLTDAMHFSFHRELQENLVRSHSAGDDTLCNADMLILMFSGPLYVNHLNQSYVVTYRCGEPVKPREDPHVARFEDQCFGQRAQWCFS